MTFDSDFEDPDVDLETFFAKNFPNIQAWKLPSTDPVGIEVRLTGYGRWGSITLPEAVILNAEIPEQLFKSVGYQVYRNQIEPYINL